jgi:hypothetical protein
LVVDQIQVCRLEGDRIAEHQGGRQDVGVLHRIGHVSD